MFLLRKDYMVIVPYRCTRYIEETNLPSLLKTAL